MAPSPSATRRLEAPATDRVGGGLVQIGMAG